MTDRRTPEQLATLAHTDSTIIATLIAPAVAHLEQDKGDGFTTHTIGAAVASVGPLQDCRTCLQIEIVQMRPCPTHDIDQVGADTAVERLAFQHDAAANDLDRLGTLMRKLTMVAAEAAAICIRWGLPGLTTTDIATRLKDIDTEIWCAHCSTFGNHEPRANEHRHCTPCVEFKRRYHELPSADCWRARDARGGKWITQDITRIRAREAAERKQTEQMRKTAARAEKSATTNPAA